MFFLSLDSVVEVDYLTSWSIFCTNSNSYSDTILPSILLADERHGANCIVCWLTIIEGRVVGTVILSSLSYLKVKSNLFLDFLVNSQDNQHSLLFVLHVYIYVISPLEMRKKQEIPKVHIIISPSIA